MVHWLRPRPRPWPGLGLACSGLGLGVCGLVNIPGSSYSAPTALGIRQEVEQIRDNVFYSTF